jgi:DNA-binding GntR family transcriptional regulator
MDKQHSRLTQIVEALEEDVLFGRLRPRERLTEDELIERFDASRHVVRQALVELEHKGMVVRPRNRGAVVRDFTRDEVDHICAVRELLHGKAASQIPLPGSPVLLKTLERLHALHSREVERGNLRGIHQMNSVFHDTLFQACGNPYLVETIRDYAQMSLAFRCQVMVNPFLARHARDEHAQMIEALRVGDRAKLVRLCTGHTRAAQDVYFQARGIQSPPANAQLGPTSAPGRKTASHSSSVSKPAPSAAPSASTPRTRARPSSQARVRRTATR